MISTDVPENSQFQNLLESMKLNKEIKVFTKYLSEHVLTTLDNIEKQKIKEVIECLEIRYGRMRLQKLEKLVSD